MLKRYKSPRIDQTVAEVIQAGSNTQCCEIHRLINPIWNKEEVPQPWKESIISPIYKKSDNTGCCKYRGLSLLPATYKMLYNIPLSVLSPYSDNTVGNH
jgi:hypothetical protein